MGKQGTRRKEIEQRTGARIQMPSIQDTSDIINVTGTRDAVEKAVQEIRMISDELVSYSFYRNKCLLINLVFILLIKYNF